MNRKFFLSGLMVSQLMQSKGISSLDLAAKLSKTRQAVYDIQKREIIKNADAYKILQALGFSLNEVEEMDNKGFFDIKKTSIIETENDNFKRVNELLESLLYSMKDVIKTQNEHSRYFEEQLKSKEKLIETKDNQINTLFGLLSGAK